MKDVSSTEILAHEPYFLFTDADLSENSIYSHDFSLTKLFHTNGSGIKFRKDPLLVSPHFTPESVVNMAKDIKAMKAIDLTTKYGFKETKDWKLEEQRTNFDAVNHSDIRQIDYRMFEKRYAYYSLDTISKIIPRGDSRKSLMGNLLHPNFSLLVKRGRLIGGSNKFHHTALTKHLVDINFLGDQTYCLPLYLYPEESDLDQTRRVNFDPTIRKEIEKAATPKGGAVPDEVAIFDYIYGVLHCPAYRETYAEFLKIDFPRIPYPASPKTFADISAKGAILRKLHLMEDATIGEAPYPFEGEADKDEDCLVGKPTFVETNGGNGAVFINTKGKQPSGQHFANVSKIAWEFFIGGYQPAQKWLKDRKGRTLTFDDIRHYQKIIKILSETHRIMQTIQMDLTKK